MKNLGKAVATRRVVLIGASLSAATLFAPYSLSEELLKVPTNPDVAKLPTESIPTTTNRYFGSDWNQEYVAAFPKSLPLDTQVPNKVLELRWDPRLFDLRNPALVRIEDDVVDLRFETNLDGSASFVLPDDASEVIFRALPISLYPNENLDSVQATELTLRNNEGSYVRTWADSAVGVDCSAWGVEASVSWISHLGQVVPALINLVSIGPNPAPSEIVMTLKYSDVGGELALLDTSKGELSSAESSLEADASQPSSNADDSPQQSLPELVNIETSTGEGTRDVTIRTLTALEPDARLDLVSPVQLSDSMPVAFSTFVPRLVVQPTPNAVGRRQSGRDSVYPVTRAGSQESTYVAAPSA